jgi:uncharacterized membrane protein YhaH (DUF805 family)
MSFYFADYRIDIGWPALGLLALAPALLSIIAIVRIVQRAGFSGWWALITFVPVVNLLALWYFAFVQWPIMRPHRSQQS